MQHKIGLGTQTYWAIDPRKWGVEGRFSGNNYGPFYVTGGRGGAYVRRQMNLYQGAVQAATRLPVQSIFIGQTLAGSYSSQSLALTGRNNQ